jgi:hypothetical protein
MVWTPQSVTRGEPLNGMLLGLLVVTGVDDTHGERGCG